MLFDDNVWSWLILVDFGLSLFIGWFRKMSYAVHIYPGQYIRFFLVQSLSQRFWITFWLNIHTKLVAQSFVRLRLVDSILLLDIWMTWGAMTVTFRKSAIWNVYVGKCSFQCDCLWGYNDFKVDQTQEDFQASWSWHLPSFNISCAGLQSLRSSMYEQTNVQK